MCHGWLKAHVREVPVNFGKPFSTLSHGQRINNVGLRKFPGYETIGAVFKIQLVNLASRPSLKR
jgi:hypothetical protein